MTTQLEILRNELSRHVVGQERVVERLIISMVAKGHCLLEGVPGVGKTMMTSTLARMVGGTFSRIQFTPDLLPADIMGTRIYRASREAFDIELGPVFANFVLADEINRAPAKVQSALLEVMAERQVSIGGVTTKVTPPFMVLATQNPIEQEGVYALPEAQRDRFLMRVPVDYPTPAQEAEIARRSATPFRRRHRCCRSTSCSICNVQPTTFQFPKPSPTMPCASSSPRANHGLSASTRSTAGSRSGPVHAQPSACWPRVVHLPSCAAIRPCGCRTSTTLPMTF